MAFEDRRPWLVVFFVAVAIGWLLAVSGGGAAKAKRAADRGADEFTGNRAVRSGGRVKAQLRDYHADRNRKIRDAYGR